jgi:hypothetical protein
MKRQLIAIAVAAGAIVATASVASAAPARASGQAPIRTLTDTVSLQLNGYGPAAGWYFHELYVTYIVRTPELAEHLVDQTSGSSGTNGKPFDSISQAYIVNGLYYAKNTAGAWTNSRMSATNLTASENGADPYYSLAKFLAIPGVKLVGPGHYQVTCTTSQLSAFFSWEYAEPTLILTENGVKTATASFWLDSSGRPVKDTISGQSSHVRLSAVETFTKYNEPLTITAP